MIGFVVFRMSSVLRNTLFDPVTGRRPEGDVSAHEKRQLLVEAAGGDRAQVTVDASGARRLTTARTRRGVLAAAALLAVWSLGRPAAAAGAPYYNLGLRWLGEAAVCQAPSGWTAARLLPALRGLPAALRDVCLYTWIAGVARPPSPRQVEELWRAAGASNMAEDVPVVHAMSSPEVMSTPEESFQTGLRGALTARVGGAGLLPTWPRYRAVRVVVIDTAPTSPHARIQLGASRHGDTLAHVIEDLVCQPLLCMDGCDAAELAARPCVSEVTTELALPWSARGIQGQRGGHVGTLADLARAIARALARWQAEGARHRLILNLSVGWEHTEQIAECSTAEPTSAPARAVRGLLQYAAAQGVLVVAAAGNDSAGPSPRVGLTCPGLYQAVPQAAHPSRALLIACSAKSPYKIATVSSAC
ncbi:MAG TPA: hypothetical protein PKU97_18400, partial [Kofleriaceae bacterium]|nr:hypothetical protein [Kofleriaceae bacterium]